MWANDYDDGLGVDGSASEGIGGIRLLVSRSVSSSPDWCTKIRVILMSFKHIIDHVHDSLDMTISHPPTNSPFTYT